MSLMLDSYLERGAWFPENGYQSVSDVFAERISELGGKIMLKTKVNKILIEQNRVIGVQTRGNKKYFSKIVVSDVDAKQTFLNLIGEQYLEDKFVKKIKKYKMSTTGLSVHLGVKMDLSLLDLKYGTIIYCPDFDAYTYFGKSFQDEIDKEGEKISIGMSVTSLFSENGNNKNYHTVDILAVSPNYEFWKNIYSQGKEEYEEYKEKYSNMMIKIAENVIPDLSNNIIVKDVATPLTYERYTGATSGSWYDIALSPDQTSINRLSSRGPVKNLYLVGAKVLGGGMAACMVSGFIGAQIILRGKALKD